MSKNNVRIAIRDATDSHNVAFFDNKAGIKYKSANLQRFLAGSASILTLKYNSKDIDSIRSGCKLAFRYKNRDYWLNVMSFEKKGYEVELTAYSLGLELNNETRSEHKPANAMSIAEYVAYYDPEHALTIGVNEVADKRIKLEWTGTDTILARLFSVANSFDAELDFNVELNDDYSLKRQVLNIYRKGNLGTNKVSQPVRVGKELKVINYSDNIKELRTAVRATGKDGLTIDGLNKKIYDANKKLLYYSSGMTVYAPQSRDRFPSVGKGSNDNWIVEDLGETQYETKEALWGYLYSEIQKKSLPEITYEVEGAIDAGIGDTQTLIDDKHFEPALYVRARVSELEDDILTGKVTKSTFINFERKYSQIADDLQKQVEALIKSSLEGKTPDVDNKNLLITSTATPNTRLVGSEVYPTPAATTENTATIKEAIKVLPGEKYTFTKRTSGKAFEWWRTSYLDSNFGFISRFTNYEEKFTITIPDGVSYMWISYPIGSNPKVEKGSTATGYVLSSEDNVELTDSIKKLDKEVVKSASLNLDNNGFVTKVDKIVDGNKFATMIAQDAENVKKIADKMQVTGDMIVDGAVTADKLNVTNLSSVNSNLGKIKGGSLLLQQNKPAGSNIDNWGSYNLPAHKQGLFIDDRGVISSGTICRKNGSETVPTDMPIAVLQSGELRFLSVDYDENLEEILHNGLSDPDFGAIRFEIDKELKRRLTMMSSGYLNFTASNYTEWKSTGVAGCEYMIQGRLVIVTYDVTTNGRGNAYIGGIPKEFVRKELMLPAKRWSIVSSEDKNIQLNRDGSLYILNVDNGARYCGTSTFAY